MRGKKIIVVALAAVSFIGAKAFQAEDPAKKLGAFVGKWETEGAFTTGQKASTTLECRWSPQGAYLVCDQLVRMAGEHRQFTVYSYDSKTGTYSYPRWRTPGPSRRPARW